MGKGQPGQIREPRAEQDTNQYGPCIAMWHGHESVKAPAKKVAQSNRQPQMNQSEHCREAIPDPASRRLQQTDNR